MTTPGLNIEMGHHSDEHTILRTVSILTIIEQSSCGSSSIKWFGHQTCHRRSGGDLALQSAVFVVPTGTVDPICQGAAMVSY